MQVTRNEYYKIPNSIDITAFHRSFYYHISPHTQNEWDSQGTWKLIMVYEGELEIVSGVERIYMKKNQLILLPSGIQYVCVNSFESENKIAYVSFQMDSIPEGHSQVVTLSTTETLELITLVRAIQKNYLRNHDYIIGIHENNLSKASITKKRLEIYLLSIFSPKRVPVECFSSDYNRIVEYLTKNVYRNLTLNIISQELNMSPSNIKRLFSKYAKVSIMQYFNQLRVQNAISLLQSGISVKAVSEILDYSSQSAFCTSFKNIMGIAPSNYYRSVPEKTEQTE